MKNILIIGGSSGIGEASVRLMSENHNVISTYNKSDIQNLNNVTYHHYDVMSEDYDTSFIPEVLDGLVYCPGSINLKPFTRFKEADFMNDYKLNVLGAISVIQKALPSLKKSSNGSIVLFSTVAVGLGFQFHSLVSSSKGAIEGLGKALAAEFAPHIRVNVIAPSLTQTPLAYKLLSSEEKIEASAKRNPLRKLGQPQDLAHMVKFLLSNESNWMTGQILHVDGGTSTLKV